MLKRTYSEVRRGFRWLFYKTNRAEMRGMFRKVGIPEIWRFYYGLFMEIGNFGNSIGC